MPLRCFGSTAGASIVAVMGSVLQLGNVVHVQWRTLAADAILTGDAGYSADVTAQFLRYLLKGRFRVGGDVGGNGRLRFFICHRRFSLEQLLLLTYALGKL